MNRLCAMLGFMTAKALLKDVMLDELRALLGERLSTSAAVCEQHGHDESYHPTLPPDAVAFARSTEEVAEIVKTCARHNRPVIAFAPAPRSRATWRRCTAAFASTFRR